MVALSSFFLNTAGLATAVVLIPFLILYLIRPKPRHEKIPSLLFIMRDTGKSNVNSLFRSFLKDILFLFHLLILLLLIGAAAKPYINVPRSFLAEQTVILLDTSASMQAGDRFEKAIDLAKENLGRENTIITITANPQILLERASSAKAEELLKTLKPTETTTSISEALNLANSFAGAGSRVVVISDFIPTAGDLDYDTTADLLEAQGAIVEYLKVTSPASNVGIIDLLVGPSQSSLWVKNFNARPTDVTVEISDAQQSVLLAPGESKEIEFNTPTGVAEIKIKENDDLPADNKIWTSTPEKNEIKLLVITNDKRRVQQSNFLLALDVISKNFPTSFDISYAEPPKIPSLNHDVYVVTSATLNSILPGYVRDLKKHVEQGAALVILDQPGVFGLDWQGLLPVEPMEENAGSRASVTPGSDSTLTEDIEFGQVSSYLRVAAKEGATPLATALSDPLVLISRVGKGSVLYFGLDDQKSTFSKDPSYPVFWRRLFDRLTNRPSLENLNLRTGTVLSLTRELKVRTPDGSITTNLLPLDKAGLYTLPDRTIAVNLLSDAEGAINLETNLTKNREESLEAGEEQVPKDLTEYALWIAIALLLLELFYVKYRGDF